MEETMSLFLHWDTQQVFLNDTPFTPRIETFECFSAHPSTNTVVIEIDARLDSRLDWQGAIEQAKQITEKGLYLIWRFNFGLETDRLSLVDPVVFATCKSALRHFMQEHAKDFEENTLGVIFYQGSSNFSSICKNSSSIEDNYKQWLIEHSIEEHSRAYRHFYADFFLSYLQMLSCEVLDSWTVFLPLDVPKGEEKAELFDYFSKERFEHFLLCLQGGSFPFPALCWQKGSSFLGTLDCTKWQKSPSCNLGLFYPSRAMACSLYTKLNAVINELDARKISYRILHEKYAVDDWNELDYVLVFSPYAESTKRMLQGFCAAGGVAVLEGPSLGLPQELELNAFLEKRDRGRGI